MSASVISKVAPATNSQTTQNAIVWLNATMPMMSTATAANGSQNHIGATTTAMAAMEKAPITDISTWALRLAWLNEGIGNGGFMPAIAT